MLVYTDEERAVSVTTQHSRWGKAHPRSARAEDNRSYRLLCVLCASPLTLEAIEDPGAAGAATAGCTFGVCGIGLSGPATTTRTKILADAASMIRTGEEKGTYTVHLPARLSDLHLRLTSLKYLSISLLVLQKLVLAGWAPLDVCSQNQRPESHSYV